MERRGFMSFLAAGVAGLMLPDTLIVEPKNFKAAVPADLIAVNIRTITEALAAEFERKMGAIAAVHRAGGYKIGDYSFNKQYNVMMALPHGGVRDIHERFINPASSTMAEMCKKNKVKRFGNLPFPVGGGCEAVTVGPIRGISLPYCVWCDNSGLSGYQCDKCGRLEHRETFRFDVLAEAA